MNSLNVIDQMEENDIVKQLTQNEIDPNFDKEEPEENKYEGIQDKPND